MAFKATGSVDTLLARTEAVVVDAPTLKRLKLQLFSTAA